MRTGLTEGFGFGAIGNADTAHAGGNRSFHPARGVLDGQQLLRRQIESLSSKLIDHRTRLPLENIVTCYHGLEMVRQSQPFKREPGAALTRRCRHGSGYGQFLQFFQECDHAGHRRNCFRHFFEEFVFSFPKSGQLGFRQFSQEVPQYVLTFAALQDEIQLMFGDLPAQGTQKLLPRPPVRRMTVDNDAIQVKNNAAERSIQSPPSRPGQVF